MKLHYFIIAAQVIYQRDKLERSKPMNFLLASKTQTVTRRQLAQAQHALQVKFLSEIAPDGKSQITDVFTQSISYLGEMTEAEFHGEFDYPGKPAPEPEEVVEAKAVPVDEPQSEVETKTDD